jgi:PAS domain S-box-containing protein
VSRVDPQTARPSFWLRPVDHFVPAALLARGGDLRTRARILAATCLAGGLMTTLTGVGHWLTGSGPSGIWVTNLIGGSSILLGAFLLRRTGSLPLTANVLLTVGWAMNTMLYVASEGTNVSALYAFAMLPVIAMLIGGPWTGLAWTIVSCVTAVVLVQSPPFVLATPLDFVIADHQAQLTRDVVLITVWLALVGALFDGVRSAAQRGAEQAQARAEESERRFALFFEANPDGIVMADAGTGEILECNDGFLEILDRPRDEVVGQLGWASALGMNEDAREAIDEVLRQHGQSGEVEVNLVGRASGDRSVRVRASRVEVEGRPCVLATVRDVTEHARLEAQLRQAQKMEAVGQLAGSIAHDFNNMLTVISGYAEHLEGSLDDELGDMAGEIRGAADRSADLTRQLLAFSRRQVLEPQVLGLNEMIRRLENLLVRLIGETIRIELVLAPDLGSVRADPGQVEQVIVNLAINARDAMPEGGELRVETARFEGCPPGGGSAGDWVRLRVCDTGHGMDEATLRRVFEPFFTTKEPGRGTGLGLSTVEGIVRQSGGEVAIRSAAGEGTTVDVHLPRLDVMNGRREGDEGVPGVPGTAFEENVVVLLVEDDDMVRRLAGRTLRGRLRGDRGERRQGGPRRLPGARRRRRPRADRHGDAAQRWPRARARDPRRPPRRPADLHVGLSEPTGGGRHGHARGRGADPEALQPRGVAHARGRGARAGRGQAARAGGRGAGSHGGGRRPPALASPRAPEAPWRSTASPT